MKLSSWAKSQGISYKTAWRWFDEGKLPVPAEQTATGTILVKTSESKEKNDHIKLDGIRIKLPKLGWVKMREALRFSGKVISATISRVANKWFVSLNIQLEHSPKTCESQASVGVDLGIKALATLSNGEAFEAPKPLKKFLKKLKRLQRSLSRREKVSNNGQKLRQKIALVHAKITNIRQDSLHKITHYLTENFGGIVIENLNVSGMLKNSQLSRAIADLGFYEFRRQLEYKSQYKGNYLLIADRWFPSSKLCSNCGNKKEQAFRTGLPLRSLWSIT